MTSARQESFTFFKEGKHAHSLSSCGKKEKFRNSLDIRMTKESRENQNEKNDTHKEIAWTIDALITIKPRGGGVLRD